MNCIDVVKNMNIDVKDKTLAVIRCGKNQDTMYYYKSIDQACDEFDLGLIAMDIENMDIEAIRAFLDSLKSCDAIIPIKPFPEHIEDILKHEIPLDKDVDNFTRISPYKSCTAEAVREILEYHKVITRGKRAVVVGSNVGWDIASELKDMGCTVIVCNSKTIDLKAETLRADILVSAAGKKDLITQDMVKDGAIILDVGLDVADNVKEKAIVTPRRNGVGIVTTAVLLRHIANVDEIGYGI